MVSIVHYLLFFFGPMYYSLNNSICTLFDSHYPCSPDSVNHYNRVRFSKHKIFNFVTNFVILFANYSLLAF